MASTSEQGDALERAIYEILKEEIAADRFLFLSDCCQIHRKKGYFSKDREKNIIFDVSIEVTLPTQSQYSLLILVECKNYGSPVPVDDAEEFYAKVDQIGSANVKAIIASTNSFQDGTMRFARSKGIGLVRYFPGEKLKWDLPRSPSTLVGLESTHDQRIEVMAGLASERYGAKNYDFYAYSASIYTNSLRQFLFNLVTDENEASQPFDLTDVYRPSNEGAQLVPYLEESIVDKAAQSVLEKIDHVAGPVDLEAIIAILTKEEGLKFSYAEPPNTSILGSIRFSPLEVLIFRENHNSIQRQRFTIAHEVGHIALQHSRYMYGEYCEGTDTDLEQPNELGIKDVMRMEWQANTFASYLLLPTSQFTADFFRIAQAMNLRNRGFGMIYLDSQPVNQEAFRLVTSKLKNKYQVSRAAVKVRLQKLGFLREARWGET